FLAILFFITSFEVRAQSPCYTVSAEIIAPPQSGPYNFFGAKVAIAQPHYQDITVTGTMQEDGGSATCEFTLTIFQGQTSAETDLYYFQTGPASSASITIESVSSCPSPYPDAIHSLSNQPMVEIYPNVGQDHNSGLEYVFDNSLAFYGAIYQGGNGNRPMTRYTRKQINI
ncbi:MAG TPA: hypothetical protein VGB46_03695, partial [Flavisolibacter sp.]